MPIPKGLQSAGKGAETSHFPGDAAPAGKTKGSRSKKAKRAFPIEELPREIQEKILQEYVAMLAPKLMMVKSSGKIPLTKKPEKQHINSKLLSEKIPAEQDVLFPLLRVSKMWYSMVSQYILRHTVYISSARALDRLTIFEMRRNMAVLDIYPLDPGPTIDNSEIDTPGRTVFGIWAQYKKDSRNIWIPTSETDTYVFDVNCQGPGWSKTKAPDDTTALPWMGIPAWIIGKSRNIGDHMYEDDKDGEVEGGKEDESSLAEGFGAPKTKRFLENMKSLILAPDWTSYADADPWCAWNVCHLERPDMNHHFPGAYLMYRILSGSGGAPELRKLVISGNILANPWFLTPKEPGAHTHFQHLTHLTMSLSHAPSPHISPLRRLRQYIHQCRDQHLCTLLTGGKPRSEGGKLVRCESAFLNTLKYLHIRGPGTQCCPELFQARWQSLEKVIIELGTHKGICEGSTHYVIESIRKGLLYRRPNLEILLTARLCKPEFEQEEYSHHFWRRFRSVLGAAPFVGTEPSELSDSSHGVSITLFEKDSSPGPGQACEIQWQDALDTLFRDEDAWAHAAATHLRSRDGLNPVTMTWDSDTIWKNAEKEAAEADANTSDDKDAEGGGLWFADVARQSMLELADNEFARQCRESIHYSLGN